MEWSFVFLLTNEYSKRAILEWLKSAHDWDVPLLNAACQLNKIADLDESFSRLIISNKQIFPKWVEMSDESENQGQ